mmetsp:Transcript_12165/g.24899  ORF Transcript_12165/g.24899 Transcript_12165/m.24899 type:complete len:110 (+) Transcript_12165:36-365(+)
MMKRVNFFLQLSLLITTTQGFLQAELYPRPKQSFTHSFTLRANRDPGKRAEIINQITLAEAIIARNEAQLGSFIDANHQWEEMDEYDKELLTALPVLQEELRKFEGEEE